MHSSRSPPSSTILRTLFVLRSLYERSLHLQVLVHDRQHHPAHHGHFTPAAHWRAHLQMSPAWLVRTDGGDQYRVDAGGTLQCSARRYTTWYENNRHFV